MLLTKTAMLPNTTNAKVVSGKMDFIFLGEYTLVKMLKRIKRFVKNWYQKYILDNWPNPFID